MNDIINDIENLETAINLIQEGASDEKRMGIALIQNIISQKQKQVTDFEKQLELEFVESI
jgi:hypothetical protein